jgi:hypothetical protein
MGTKTVQFLVGHSHMYEGGIIPSHQLFLSENGRSAWMLKTLEQMQESKEKEAKPIVWVSTLEYMLEEALVLIMLHVLQDKEACGKARELLGWSKESYMELYAYPEETRKQLYTFVKFVISSSTQDSS